MLDDKCNKTKVKVLILWPNGDTFVRIPPLHDTIHLIKNIALKNWKTAANYVFKHEELQKEIPKALWRALDTEFSDYCSSDTVLKGSSPSDLMAFSNNVFIREIAVSSPIWNTCIRAACGIDIESKLEDEHYSKKNPVVLATSVAARARNKTLSAFAYRISCIIFHSGASHQDIIRLNRLGVCMSPDMIISLQHRMGENFDAKVIKWKKELEESHLEIESLALLNEIKEKQLPQLEDDDMDLDVVLDLSEPTLKHYENFKPEVLSDAIKIMTQARSRINVDDFTDEVLNSAINHHRELKYSFFQLVGDNIDHQIYARIQTKDRGNQSIHWTHQYAIRDRVGDCTLDNTKPLKKIQNLQLLETLPTPEVQSRIKQKLKVIVSRVITKYLPAFEPFRKVVIHHIPHPYSLEAKQKSDICCLGLEFYNPNVAGEMAQLLMANQGKYVPCLSLGECTSVATQIPFHGDQLFEERARNVKWTFQDGDNDLDQLDGLCPEFADWHAKVTLYEMEYHMFYKPESCAELGTTKASINRTRKTNAAPGPKKKYNEYKEFHRCEVEAHICASFMEVAGMTQHDDQPSFTLPEETDSKEVKGNWLLNTCESYVDKYLFKEGDIDSLVKQTHELELASLGHYKCRVQNCDKSYLYHSARVSHEINVHHKVNDRRGQLRDEYGYFFCRAECGNVFSTKSTRNRHERNLHPSFIPGEVNNSEEQSSKVPSDPLYNYHCAKLKFGLILFEFNDAIQEGDGQRLHDLYKLVLLLYKSGGHYKYAYVVYLYLVNIACLYTEFRAFQLKWNRFYNRYGLVGKNIPLDLKKEQQNKVLKTLWRALGPNLNEANAARLAKTLEPLEKIVHSIDNDCGLLERPGYRSSGAQKEAVMQILSDLLEIKAFKFIPGREGHRSFPDFCSSLISVDYRDLHSLMKEKKELWGSIFDRSL